ncbi:MAG TPA: GNAT family N-acetyltransferase [Candidatus Limnocylindrales bacterium]|nr:GNAT family N-acetyltransferase [Candidatus Limnocylindrales bacterium]
MFDEAWPDGSFSDDDMAHAMGGRHWLVEVDGRIVSHTAVVERVLEVEGRPLRTGYVEAVATAPGWRGLGFGSRVVTAANAFIAATFELGAL